MKVKIISSCFLKLVLITIYRVVSGAILCLQEGSKTGSECSPKLVVLQDSAFEPNVVYEVNFLTVYLPIDLIFPIRCSLHFSCIRISPIVLYPLKSDAIRLIVTFENGCNRCRSIHRLKI